ncbi:heme peroxidase [Mycena rebaudengoi]|nr:heme peroxidase [Mycena rebaudengoi]
MLRLALLATFATANAYLWPAPILEELDSLLYEIQPGTSGIASYIQPCDTYHFTPANISGPTGRTNLADFIRTAYHDMATHNSSDGTGGLDASIRLAEEKGRNDNFGDTFSNALTLLIPESTRYVSVADVIALAVRISVEKCGGPVVPFRGGRVDAMVPNSPGVPAPREPLDSHIAAFAKQGFTPQEMISLVACGHTFGGVQHAFFSGIVPELNDPSSTLSVAHFDTTNHFFDNNIATEYIFGTTKNPLVVGLNDTTNSDKRIFGHDGNVTMLKFAKSPEHFRSTCATMFARMLDTVPNGVQLSEVITPLPVKPQDLKFQLDGNVLHFSGRVRFWDLPTVPKVVLLLWNDHFGRVHNFTLDRKLGSSHTFDHGTATYYIFGDQLAHDGFVLDAASGIKNMRFRVDGKLKDQGGVGFAVQDSVVFSSTSCFFGSNRTAKYNVAVRSDVKVTSVYIETEARDSTGHVGVTATDFFSRSRVTGKQH